MDQTESFLHILVIDDEELLTEMVKEMLDTRFKVRCCLSVQQALKELQDFIPDIILCDFLMPGQTGKELYEVLEKSAQKLHQKIIFLTGGVYTEEGKQFFNGVQNLILEKPFTSEELLKVIEKHKRQAI